MEHSRLLKYLVPGTDKIKMADTPTFKLQYDYKNPENVESEVPGRHKLRDGPSTSEGNKVEVSNENFTLSPVITVTKQEATFTKGDLKLQKVSVTEDISEETGQPGGVYYRREVRRQVSRGIMMKDNEGVRSANGKPEDNTKIDEKKPRTRIPKLRQTVEKMKERRVSKENKDNSIEKKDNETPTIVLRRSSIPKLKNRKHQPTTVKEETKVVKTEVRSQPDEEFDKLFEDLVQNRKSQIIDDFIVNTKVDDPEKVEIKFEEIVHDYEGDKLKPVHVEKARPSKIPFLKRKSEQEITVSALTDKATKISSTVEDHKVRNTIPKLKNNTSSVSSETSEKHIVTRRITKTITTKKLSYDNSISNEVSSHNETIEYSNTTNPTETVKITEIQEQSPTEDTEFKFNENVKVRPGFSRHLRTIANTYKQNANNDSKVKLTETKKDIIQNTVEEDKKKAETTNNSDISVTKIESEDKFHKQNSKKEIKNNQKDIAAEKGEHDEYPKTKDDKYELKQHSLTEIEHTVNGSKKDDVSSETIHDGKIKPSKQNSVTETIIVTESTSQGNEINTGKGLNFKEIEYKEVMYEDNTAKLNNTDDEKSKRNISVVGDIFVQTNDFNLQNNTDTVVITTSINTINDSNKSQVIINKMTENIYEVKPMKKNEITDSEHDIERVKPYKKWVEIERESDNKQQKIKQSVKIEETDSNKHKNVLHEDTYVKSVTIEKEGANDEESKLLKGKVGKLINQIEVLSPEVQTKEFAYEIPQKKSVLSKIAMFERKEVNEPMPKPRQILSKYTKSDKLTSEYLTDNINNEMGRKPIIVDEILKENNAHSTANKDQIPRQDNTVQEIKAVEEILEVLDRELDANDIENEINIQKTIEVNINKIEIAPKLIVDLPVIVPKLTTVLKEPHGERNSDITEHRLYTPSVVEERKVISDVLKPNQIILTSVADQGKPDFDTGTNETNKLTNHTLEVEISKSVDNVITFPQSTQQETIAYKRVLSNNATEDALRYPSNKIEIPEIAFTRDFVKHASERYEKNLSMSAVEVVINKVQNSIMTDLNDQVLERCTETNKKDKEFIFPKSRPTFDSHVEDKTKIKGTDEITEVTKEASNRLHFKGNLVDNEIVMSRSYSTTEFTTESSDNYPKYKTYISETTIATQEDGLDALNAVDNLKRLQKLEKDRELSRAKSLAELDLGDAVKGHVNRLIVRMRSTDHINEEKREVISIKERPRKQSVLEKIALFERIISPVKMETVSDRAKMQTVRPAVSNVTDEMYREKIAELNNAKTEYGQVAEMPTITLRGGSEMPMFAVGTALLDPKLTPYIISAAIDLGYRAFDTAFIYGNEKEVGAAIKAKIDDGSVKREELFITSKLWSTFHRQDLVEVACKASLQAMGLTYFDLYLIHNPMSFKEGADPIPKIATVVQYSTSDFMDAWYGMERLVTKGLVKCIGVSNFNSRQIAKIVEKGKIKPAVNQVECHPYLSQQRLDSFCSQLGVKLSCFGVLGSKGTPVELKSTLPAVIDDPLVVVMASGLQVTPAQLLIRYQLQCGHSVVVKSSSAAHLWDNLQALNFVLSQAQVEALHALNKNKRTFTFKGMGETHKNYPFSEAF